MQQYWAGDPDAYSFVGVSQLAEAFNDSGIGFSEMGDDAPDLEKGTKLKQKGDSKEENSRENGGKGEKTPNMRKGQALDPLVHNK